MDDDESLLVTTAAMLLREGYDVRTARDGFEALAVLRGSVPEPVSLRPEIAEVINRHARATLKVAIAGDLHHYRRHESVDGSSVQLITSGGGGAFLLGTAGPKVNKLEFGTPPKQFALQSEFPDRKTSLRLLLRNFAFPFINPKFGLVTGIMYLLIAWIYRVPVLHEYEALLKRSDPVSNTIVIVRILLASPFGFGVLALVVVGFIAFTDTHVPSYKYLAGSAHALANLDAMFVISAAASKIARNELHLPDGSIRPLMASAVLIFLGGYVASAFIMGIYLYISHVVFRRHSQEAFSSLRIADYKNFIRFHLDANRSLSIHAVGLKSVPGRWVTTKSPSVPEYEPAGNKHLDPQLIELVSSIR